MSPTVSVSSEEMRKLNLHHESEMMSENFETFDIQSSVFAPRKLCDEIFFWNCFEVDWKYSKIPFLIIDVNDKSMVKAILKHYYKDIRNTYKYFAGLEIENNVPGIMLKTVLDFVT